MKRYHMFNVKLNSGAECVIKVTGNDVDAFNRWISTAPGVTTCEEIRAVAPIKGHSGKKTKIAIARMAAGFTQQEMADKLGVRISQYQRWEYGIYRVKMADLMRIGKILDVDWLTLAED